MSWSFGEELSYGEKWNFSSGRWYLGGKPYPLHLRLSFFMSTLRELLHRTFNFIVSMTLWFILKYENILINYLRCIHYTFDIFSLKILLILKQYWFYPTTVTYVILTLGECLGSVSHQRGSHLYESCRVVKFIGRESNSFYSGGCQGWGRAKWGIFA